MCTRGLSVSALVAFTALSSTAGAQVFQRLAGDRWTERAFDMEQTPDGGFITVGSVLENGDEDFYILKHRANGTIEWRVRYGGPGRDRATSVHQTPTSGLFIIAGHTESADLGPDYGLALLVIDDEGNLRWAWAYEGASFEAAWNPALPGGSFGQDDPIGLQPAVRRAANGDYIVASNRSLGQTQLSPHFLRVDSNGSVQVSLVYNDLVQGDQTFAAFTDLKELDGGDIVFTGFWTLPQFFDGPPRFDACDALAMRTNASGGPQWTTRINSETEVGIPLFESGFGIDVSPDGSKVVLGNRWTDFFFDVGDFDRTRGRTGGSLHHELDALAGLLLTSSMRTGIILPSYAATRYTSSQSVVTAGVGGVTGGSGGSPIYLSAAGPGAAIKLSPGLAAIDTITTYGPPPVETDISFTERLEAAAIDQVNGGIAFAGNKASRLGATDDDQFLVKTNDALESCNDDQPPLNESPVVVLQSPVQFELQPQNETRSMWGEVIPNWEPRDRLVCYFDENCPADVNGDGILDNGDINFFVQLFLTGNPAADINGDGILDNGDINAFVAAFLAGC